MAIKPMRWRERLTLLGTLVLGLIAAGEWLEEHGSSIKTLNSALKAELRDFKTPTDFSIAVIGACIRQTYDFPPPLFPTSPMVSLPYAPSPADCDSPFRAGWSYFFASLTFLTAMMVAGAVSISALFSAAVAHEIYRSKKRRSWPLEAAAAVLFVMVVGPLVYTLLLRAMLQSLLAVFGCGHATAAFILCGIANLLVSVKTVTAGMDFYKGMKAGRNLATEMIGHEKEPHQLELSFDSGSPPLKSGPDQVAGPRPGT